MIKSIQNKFKNRKGFTLIELIIVIAILGILVAIVVPKFSKIQHNAKVGADVANAKLIASTTASLLAEGEITVPASTSTYVIDGVKDALKDDATADVDDKIEAALQEMPTIKSDKTKKFVVQITKDGDISILDAVAGNEIYPTTADAYKKK